MRSRIQQPETRMLCSGEQRVLSLNDACQLHRHRSHSSRSVVQPLPWLATHSWGWPHREHYYRARALAATLIFVRIWERWSGAHFPGLCPLHALETDDFCGQHRLPCSCGTSWIVYDLVLVLVLVLVLGLSSRTCETGSARGL